MKTISHFIAISGCLILAGILTACSSSQTPTSPAPASSTTSIISTTSAAPTSSIASDIQSWADPATETTLQGLSENNLEKYTQYFSQATKAAVTKDVFEKTSAQIQAQFGDYVSKTFLSTENKDNYVIVRYQAKYSKGSLKVRMVFDANRLIAGQWFE